MLCTSCVSAQVTELVCAEQMYVRLIKPSQLDLECSGYKLILLSQAFCICTVFLYRVTDAHKETSMQNVSYKAGIHWLLLMKSPSTRTLQATQTQQPTITAFMGGLD